MLLLLQFVVFFRSFAKHFRMFGVQQYILVLDWRSSTPEEHLVDSNNKARIWTRCMFFIQIGWLADSENELRGSEIRSEILSAMQSPRYMHHRVQNTRDSCEVFLIYYYYFVHDFESNEYVCARATNILCKSQIHNPPPGWQFTFHVHLIPEKTVNNFQLRSDWKPFIKF